MVDSRPRGDRIPNANNPRLLVRMLALVASGIRRPKALAELLDVELRTVHYYSQAAEWLALVTVGEDLHLTDAGLELAMADPRRRRKLYAAAVWRNPLAAELLDGRGQVPETDVIASVLRSREPTLAEATARRRATAVRGLIAPAVGGRAPDRAHEQLRFPFPPPARTSPQRVTDLRAGHEESPDVYAMVLRALLDNGELGTSHLRAVLDRASEGDLPLASYAEMAVRRGDARRQDDRLVVTNEACAQPQIADDPVLIALTDPAYRTHLALLEANGRAPSRQRFRMWDVRIFGEPLENGQVAAGLARVLMGRRLDGLPLRGEGTTPVRSGGRPFVHALGTGPLMVAFPESLRQLAVGVGKLNDQIRIVRQAPASVRLPSIVDPRIQVHAGIFFPGEALPVSIPDTYSLRLKLLVQTPAFSLLGALLLLDRRPDVPLAVLRAGDTVRVRWERDDRGDLIDVFATFLRAHDAIVARAPSYGILSSELVALATTLGVARTIEQRVVLDEELFVQLQGDAETRLVYEELLPVVDLLHAWLDAV
jgi:hypothetical protein